MCDMGTVQRTLSVQARYRVVRTGERFRVQQLAVGTSNTWLASGCADGYSSLEEAERAIVELTDRPEVVGEYDWRGRLIVEGP